MYVCIYHGRSRKNYCSVSLKKIDVDILKINGIWYTHRINIIYINT